jgi:hypothetical protein
MATITALRESLASFSARSYPRRLFGESVAGVELAELDPQVVGLASRVAAGQSLSVVERERLSTAVQEALRVASELVGDERAYFENLASLGALANELAA